MLGDVQNYIHRIVELQNAIGKLDTAYPPQGDGLRNSVLRAQMEREITSYRERLSRLSEKLIKERDKEVPG